MKNLLLTILIMVACACRAESVNPQAHADIESVCSYISSGDFEEAQRHLLLCRNGPDGPIRQLKKIIDEHEEYASQREAARSDHYSRYNIQLDDFRGIDLSGNYEMLAEAFQLAEKTYSVANEHQKQSILNDMFIKQIVDTSLSRSFMLELNGNWLGAYRDCYRHLQKMYPDKIEYVKHSQNLLEKNEILASLSDSPCENYSDRYAGIDKDTFIKAIDMLDNDYVVRITDYRPMAQAALKRCNLLTEVISGFDPANNNTPASGFEVDASLIQNLRSEKHLSSWKGSLALANDRLRSNKGHVSKEMFLKAFNRMLGDNESTIGLPPEVLIYHFSQGAFSGIDRHTAIIWPKQVEDFTKKISGKFSGVGITFSRQDGHWAINSLLLDSPAYRSSLRTGDIIYAVNGTQTVNMTASCMVAHITGDDKSTVNLTIKTPGKSASRDVKLKRASISVPSVRGWQRTDSGKWRYLIDPQNHIGYIRISSFTETTAEDFKAALEQLELQGLNGLILDLRSNPGGRVDAAVKVLENFIEKGMIVSIRPRFGMPTYYSAHKNVRQRNCPITVLINNNTASAAEIVAGALQDEKHKRATLIGERSFGKGSVQKINSIAEKKAKLKMTLAYYHLPSGQKVEASDVLERNGDSSWGIAPDVEVPLTQDERKKVTEIITANETLLSKKQSKSSDGLHRYSNIETISNDPQLYTAMLVLKAKMAAKAIAVR